METNLFHSFYSTKNCLDVHIHEITQSVSQLLITSYFVNELAVPDHEINSISFTAMFTKISILLQCMFSVHL